METSKSSILSFTGNGDVQAFLAKIDIHAALKGYTGEKLAQALASKLEGPAFDVYLRLSTEDRKDPEKLKAELKREFEKGKRNREEALSELANRPRREGESTQNYAYKLLELVKLAYPSFDNKTLEAIAKDYFVKGLHSDMQVALKSLEKFSDAEIRTIADETTRLELAGIRSLLSDPSKNKAIFGATNPSDDRSMVDSIAEKVIEKLQLQTAAINLDDGGKSNEINFAARNRGRGFQFRNYRAPGRGRSVSSNRSTAEPRQMRCRTCQSTEHLFRKCPTRFCQACGARGHDAWDKSCPNFQ